jgi:hypothetical protein
MSKLSAFTVVRNAEKYYFPIKACIESVLPLVDEFIVALGNNENTDNTEAVIRSINSDKVRIIHRDWDENLFKDAAILREETTFALNQCKGDWCIYLQADEVVHEDDHPLIRQLCDKYQEDREVQGFLFEYLHFWGDYHHYSKVHSAYLHEIRIVRNHIHVESYRDAQSFRINGTEKLNVLKTRARIFHYGWVRPPEIMNAKRKEQHSIHWGKNVDHGIPQYFEYGPLGRMTRFTGTHPAVMQEWIKKLDWQDMLDYGKKLRLKWRDRITHEKPKDRVLTFIENKILGGHKLFGWRNWNEINK